MFESKEAKLAVKAQKELLTDAELVRAKAQVCLNLPEFVEFKKEFEEYRDHWVETKPKVTGKTMEQIAILHIEHSAYITVLGALIKKVETEAKG